MVSRAILNGWPLVPPSRSKTAPVNKVVPSISGTFTVGQTLTSSDGTWDGFPPITYSRQWLRDGVPISGATGSTYTLVADDSGHIISATVTASNPDLGSASKDAVGALVQGGGGQQPIMAIATRGVGPSGVIRFGGATDSNYTRVESRLLHYSGVDPITEVQLEAAAYYMATAGGEAAMPNDYTAVGAIEYNGQVMPVTWDGGAASKLIPASPLSRYPSDLTQLGFTIPPNTAFYLQWGVLLSSGGVIYAGDIRTGDTTRNAQNRSTAATSQVGTVGPWSLPPGGNAANLGGVVSPISIKARRAAGSKSVVVNGNSIAYGTGDQNGDGQGNSGYIARACYIGNGTNKLPYTKLTRPSETAGNMVGTKGDTRRLSFDGHSLLVSEWGMNDLGFGSATVAATPKSKATVIADLKDALTNAVWLPAKAKGLKVYQCLITPRVKGSNITSLTSSGTTCTATVKSGHTVPTVGQTYTIEGASPSTYNGSIVVTGVSGQQFTYTAASAPASTPATLAAGFGTIHVHNGYTTQDFQFPDDGFEPGGQLRDVINQWIKDQVTAGVIDGYLDPNPGIEFYNAGVPTGRFQTASGACTDDGLHPNALGAGGGATAIAPTLYAAA